MHNRYFKLFLTFYFFVFLFSFGVQPILVCSFFCSMKLVYKNPVWEEHRTLHEKFGKCAFWRKIYFGGKTYEKAEIKQKMELRLR